MELLYEAGNLQTFKEGTNQFTIYSFLPDRRHLDILGMYCDKDGVVKRIRRDSVYGKKILKVLGKEDPLSPNAERLKKITTGLADKWDMNKAIK